MNFDEIKEKVIKLLEDSKFAVLATAAKNGAVDTAQMCIVNDGLKVYMQTDSKFDKVKNIKENPNVAINLGAYNLFGKAKIVGHPKINQNFIETMKIKHSPSYKYFTNLDCEVLIEVILEKVKFWEIVKGSQDTLTYVDFKKQTVKTIKIDKM